MTAPTRVIFELIARGKRDVARKAIMDSLEEARQIEPPPSKIRAIEPLWCACFMLEDARAKQTVLDALLAACSAADSWRAGRMMAFVSRVVAAENKGEAQRIIDTMRESRYKRRAQEWLDAQINDSVRAVR